MFERQIQAGAKLLEEKVEPDWFKKIDLQRLDMFHCTFCVLGQIFGDYFDGLAQLEGVQYHFEVSDNFAIDHGFTTSAVDGHEFDQLTQEWMAYIGLLVHRSGNFDS